MKKKNTWLLAAAALFVLLVLLSAFFFYILRSNPPESPRRVVLQTWQSYKSKFVQPEGRVIRTEDGDTVSEGQAYAMLRAVWMNDKETFDRCYYWTEKHLSRLHQPSGDHLLSWRWKDGAVTDAMSASDADLDYALALLLAESRWNSAAPAGADGYAQKARAVLSDVMRLQTFRTKTGRLYLSPWILSQSEKAAGVYPQNPSYYSPAAFRIFSDFMQDHQWKRLAETSYFVLNETSGGSAGLGRSGLPPDWVLVDEKDRFYPMPGRNSGFGWEAVRVPWRVAMDHVWFAAPQARDYLRKNIYSHIEKEWMSRKAIYSEYDNEGRATNPFENALYYSAYAITAWVVDSPIRGDLFGRYHRFLVKEGGALFFDPKEDYYVNSLAWLAEGFRAGNVRLFKGSGESSSQKLPVDAMVP